MSLNTSGGFCLIKPAKLFMCTQNTGHTVPSVWGHGSLPLNYSGNVTRTEIYLPTSFILLVLQNWNYNQTCLYIITLRMAKTA